MLVPAGDQITALALAGAYRPQPGRAGAGLDRAIVRKCAMAAIRSFLARVACALVHPAGTPGLTGNSPPQPARLNNKLRERCPAMVVSPDLGFYPGAGDGNRTRTISSGSCAIRACRCPELRRTLSLSDRGRPLFTRVNGTLMARGLCGSCLSEVSESRSPGRLPACLSPPAYSGSAARCFCQTRTAATAQIATAMSTSRGHTKLFEPWDTTWVTFPPTGDDIATWDTRPACITLRTSMQQARPGGCFQERTWACLIPCPTALLPGLSAAVPGTSPKIIPCISRVPFSASSAGWSASTRSVGVGTSSSTVQYWPYAGPTFQICRCVSVVGWRLGSSVGHRRQPRSDLRLTSVFLCVARGFKPRASFRFTDCRWWRPLTVHGGSGTSAGHAWSAPVMRGLWCRLPRDRSHRAGDGPCPVRAGSGLALGF